MSLPTRAEFEQMLGQYANALSALIDPTSDAGKTAVIAAERRRALSDAFDAQAAEVARLVAAFDGLTAEHAAAERRIRELVEELTDVKADRTRHCERAAALEYERSEEHTSELP